MVGVGSASGMTLFRRRQRHECIDGFSMRLWIGPILGDASPLGAQALPIGVGILDYKSAHPLRMRHNHAEADRPAVIMKVESTFIDFELVEETVGRLGQVIKGIRIRRWRRGITLAS